MSTVALGTERSKCWELPSGAPLSPLQSLSILHSSAGTEERCCVCWRFVPPSKRSWSSTKFSWSPGCCGYLCCEVISGAERKVVTKKKKHSANSRNHQHSHLRLMRKGVEHHTQICNYWHITESWCGRTNSNTQIHVFKEMPIHFRLINNQTAQWAVKRPNDVKIPAVLIIPQPSAQQASSSTATSRVCVTFNTQSSN